MSVEDISTDTVLAAVRAGHDDIYKLADHFEVPHASSTLRLTVARLLGGGGLATIGHRGAHAPVPVLAVA